MLNSIKSNKFTLEFIAIILSLIALLFVFTKFKSYEAKASDLIRTSCEGQVNFYSPIELYPEDRKSFSENAKAFEILANGGSFMRVVSDYGDTGEGSVLFRVAVIAKDNASLDLNGVNMFLDFSDGEKTDLLDGLQKDLAGDSSYILEHQRKNISSDNLSADLVFKKSRDDCSGIIPNFVVMNAKTSVESRNFKPSYKGVYYFGPGYSPIGFSSWRNLQNFTKSGLTVLAYRSNDKSWVLNPQDSEYLARPGTAYYVYNPSSKTVKINDNDPYYVPDSVSKNMVYEGWNFLYNDSGNDQIFTDIEVTPTVSDNVFNKNIKNLGLLLEDEEIIEDAYIVNSNGELDKIKVSKDTMIPDGSFYWIYISKIPAIDTLVTDFDLEMIGGGDSYSKGEYIPLILRVKNVGKKPMKVSDPASEDYCQAGFEFYNSNGDLIESTNQGCPAWPKQISLNPGDYVDYNYSWHPDDVSGEVVVRSYFDYARLGISNIMYNEARITIK